MTGKRVSQGCAFLPNLYNKYSKAILSETNTLPGFIGGRYFNNIKYAGTGIYWYGQLRVILDCVVIEIVREKEEESSYELNI